MKMLLIKCIYISDVKLTCKYLQMFIYILGMSMIDMCVNPLSFFKSVHIIADGHKIKISSSFLLSYSLTSWFIYYTLKVIPVFCG